ncbi:helix-turn-helix domain-containing protein [Streptomyces botrytidirepellens]|uniref:Helix-turn-helix domain-containing protein n=1 Tax=Streptomyces botrytidirepellens TaxID=2486417 RepID=A0A3M8SMG1_9ACTN|nr:helix-turn-helix domain-containing protein [Streptomyces botrytidirepellens]RNF79992.1 helix-turn-helix domain-containing protein [Streptomyces botrytidirepellens]
MYDVETRKRALALVQQGRSVNSVSKQTGISRWAIRNWQTRLEPVARTADCTRCAPEPRAPADTAAYTYLLGLYLGDGCVSPLRKGLFFLRIACADAWPGLIDACAGAMRAVHPRNSVCRVQRQGYVMVTGYSKHWPCLFPQHGPGKKHERPIVLVTWQREIVATHPWELVRGLVHSDGCRITNWTTKIVAGARKRYEYPRYFFTNRSDDIRKMYTDTLDRLGVAWRQTNAWNISVARRDSVALMDAHVGPKY